MVLQAGKRIAVSDEEKALLKQRIIKAAVAVFGRFGYEKSTISLIAQEADLGRGTMYWYFKSKEDLFRHIIQAVASDLIDPLQGILDNKAGLEIKLRKLIHSWLETAVRRQEFFRIFYSVFSQSKGDFAREMLHLIRGMYKTVIGTLETMYDQAVAEDHIKIADTHRLARLTIGVVDGVIIQHMFVESVKPERMTEIIIQLMLKGLKEDNKFK